MGKIHKIILNKTLTDPEFAKEVASKLPPSSFDNDVHKQLFSIIKRHYITNNQPLDESSLVTLVEDNMYKRNKSEEEVNKHIEEATSLYEIPEPDNGEVIEDQIKRFVRRTLTIKTLKETIGGNKSLEDEEVLTDLAEELKQIAVIDTTGNEDENFLDFFKDTDKKFEMYKNLKKTTKSTGFNTIDGLLDGGGLSRGEMMLIIAQSGKGKTTAAIQMANNAVKKGMNTLYITLEEQIERVTSRIESNLIGTNIGNFKDDYEQMDRNMFDSIQDLYKQQPNLGQLFISKHNPQEVTIEKLEQLVVDTMFKKGLNIDYVVIDYPALMKNQISSGEDKYEAEGALFEKIRGLASKYKFICTTLAQTNRTAWAADVVTAENVEGAKRIVNACELILTINRTQKEYENGFIRFHISKIRNPRSGIIIPELIGLKVEQDGYVIRDCTETESSEHQRILKEDEGEEPKKDPFTKATEKVDNINNMIW